ncbi:Uu.00g012550.m01.CDS01 [Anthostomella pinea]|uniref:Uu.00g012550.m01.CDS01 n=1 Tax=Anthostomella pinea TaxID=933095 RepID=A0AAI8VS75_9PEZI|nr:Uu.00g012550.m01.CDS01 [Anthostomella pinea]
MLVPRRATFAIELGLYPLVIAAIVLVISKHWRRKNVEWLAPGVPIIIMSAMRIASASLGLASDGVPSRPDLLAQSARIDTVLIGPLVLTLVGLLKAANAPVPSGYRSPYIIPMQIVGVMGAVLAGVGSVQVFGGASTDGLQATGHTLMRTGVLALLIPVYLLTIGLAVASLYNVSFRFYRTETNMIVCLLSCTPFVLVRIVYSTISLFASEGSVFRLLTEDTGAVGLHFAMVVLVELVVTFNVCVTGMLAAGLKGEIDPPVDLKELNDIISVKAI